MQDPPLFHPPGMAQIRRLMKERGSEIGMEWENKWATVKIDTRFRIGKLAK
jgi:hypothetical protein